LTRGARHGYAASAPMSASPFLLSGGTMAVDIQKMFNEMLPSQIAAHPDAAKQIGAKFQVNITGEGGGEWYIDVSETGPKAQNGNPGGADCTITITTEDFQKLVENPQANGMQLFFAGKLKVAGNVMLAQKLGKLFNLGS
jgi:putative sterol carrier protein